jgi:hypothetical protein
MSVCKHLVVKLVVSLALLIIYIIKINIIMLHKPLSVFLERRKKHVFGLINALLFSFIFYQQI